LLPYYLVTGFVAILAGLSRYTHRTYTAIREKEIDAGLEAKPISATRWSFFDYLIVIVLICFSALRFEVGSDFPMYSRTYESLLPNDWGLQIQLSQQEIGYTALSLWLRTLSDSPHLIFWATSLITVVPVYATIKKKSADPFLSVLLYILLAFFVSPFNIVRQGIAVALNFWASTFLDKNKKAFVVINAVAACFHTSVIVVALVQLIIHKWKPSKKKFLLVIVAAIVAAAGLHSFTFLADLLNKLNGRYDAYIDKNAVEAGLGTYLVIGVTIALLIYAYSLGRIRENGTYFMLVLVGAALLIVGTQAIAISRMQLYFGIFVILLIPNQMHSNKRSVLEKFVLIAAAAVYFGVYLTYYGGLLPYQTYFDAAL
jgi:hypothetical protein